MMSTRRKRQTDDDNNNDKVIGGYWSNWVLSSIRIRDVHKNYNLIYLFYARPIGGAPGTTGEIYFDQTDDGRSPSMASINSILEVDCSFPTFTSIHFNTHFE